MSIFDIIEIIVLFVIITVVAYFTNTYFGNVNLFRDSIFIFISSFLFFTILKVVKKVLEDEKYKDASFTKIITESFTNSLGVVVGFSMYSNIICSNLLTIEDNEVLNSILVGLFSMGGGIFAVTANNILTDFSENISDNVKIVHKKKEEKEEDEENEENFSMLR